MITRVPCTSSACLRQSGVLRMSRRFGSISFGDFRFASTDGERRGVVLGKLVASRYNAWPGDKINLISISGVKMNAVTGGFVPRVYQFEVTGIFETGMYEYDNAYVYVALDEAQEFARSERQ